MKNFSFIVGIDVSKLKLDVTFLNEPLEKKLFHFMVENNPKGITKIIKTLKKKLLDLNNVLMQQIIAENEAFKKQNELIQSIPGVGPQTALYLILTTKSFHSFDNWRQLACYAGVVPFEYSSGTSIRGRTKVSHLADKKLKSLLNLCALNMKKYDPEIKAYFDKKVEEGKPKMLVINNIRAKIISRVFAAIKRGTPYVNTYKFAS